MMTPEGDYDEALTRLHHTGPEFDGWLSNHGPMVVEALARRDAAPAIRPWTDAYLSRLDELPVVRDRLGPDDWRDELGNSARLGDWIDFFVRAVQEVPWAELVAIWWPRLLPGIAAGATHGVIRTGHALGALHSLDTAPRRAELAHALGYWAARWHAVPINRPHGGRPAAEALDAVPAVPDQRFGIRWRLPQLARVSEFPVQTASLARPASAAAVPAALAAVTEAALQAYPRWAHGNPTMLVHAATAPQAMLRALPSLPQSLWLDSFDAAWTATAAVVAAYRPLHAAPVRAASSPEDAFARSVDNGGEHIVKLADTMLSAWERSGDPAVVAALDTAIRLGA